MSILNQTDHKSTTLIPLTEWPKHHAWPPLGGLRYLVFNADKNGFSSVIRRVGKRVLISEPEFFEWVEKQNQSRGKLS